MRIAICMLTLTAIALMGCNDSQTTESERGEATNPSTAPSDVADTTSADDPVAPQDVRSEAQETLETAEELIAQEQSEYRAQVAARLDKIQQHIDALKQQLGKSPPTAGVADLQKTFERLEQQMADARKKVEQETAETRETWNELKTAVDEATDQLEATTEEARKQLESEKDPQATDENQPSQNGGADNQEKAQNARADTSKAELTAESSKDDTK